MAHCSIPIRKTRGRRSGGRLTIGEVWGKPKRDHLPLPPPSLLPQIGTDTNFDNLQSTNSSDLIHRPLKCHAEDERWSQWWAWGVCGGFVRICILRAILFLACPDAHKVLLGGAWGGAGELMPPDGAEPGGESGEQKLPKFPQMHFILHSIIHYTNKQWKWKV